MRNSTLQLIMLVYVVSVMGPRPAHAQMLVTGMVIDNETGTGLPDVHVYEEESAGGTVTNAEGRFSLSLPALPATIVVQHMGYDAEVLDVDIGEAGDLIIRLSHAVLELGELVVSAEDFATRLMRRVIARKQRMYERLRHFEAVGITRLVLEHEGRIVHLSDATFDLTWQRDGPAHADLSTVSRTSSMDRELPMPEAYAVPNLYDDVIAIQGLDVIGPTHPDALDFYVFRAESERSVGERVLYDINVTPLGEREATFVGQISIQDDVMVEARLRPARHLTYPPPVSGWSVLYTQHYREVAESLWLPAGLTVTGMLTTAVDARTTRSVGLDRRTLLSNHRTDIDFGAATAAAPFNDPQFRTGRVLMPMTAREEAALESIRTMTLRDAFPPERREGWLTPFVNPDDPSRLRWPDVMGYVFRFRYNRVDGVLASVGQQMPFHPRFHLTWRLAQATGNPRIRSMVRARTEIYRGVTGIVSYERDIVPRGAAPRLSQAATSLQMAFGGLDYDDYLWRERSAVSLETRLGGLRLTVGVTQDSDASVEREVGRSWPYARLLRPNPAVLEGTIRTARAVAELETGWSAVPSIEFQFEHGSRSLLASAAAFTQLMGEMDLSIPTLQARRPDPARLDVLLRLGKSSGDVPPQRMLTLDGALRVLNGMNLNRSDAFRTWAGRPLEGESHVGVFWRHDFTTLPFELARAWTLVRSGTGLALFGAHGRTWHAPPFAKPTPRRFLHEIGISLTRVGGTPLHIDAALRLDEPGGSVGLGLRL